MIDIAARSQPGLGTVRRALSRREFLDRAAAFGVAAPYSVFTEPAWRKQYTNVSPPSSQGKNPAIRPGANRAGRAVVVGRASPGLAGAGGGGQQLTPEQAILENPAPGSFQSGIGVLSGWVCEAETVELEFETATGTMFTEEAGYGTERLDTAGVCGDTDNGFGLLYNWNRLGDGQHTVRAYADGEEFAHSTFTVTTLGEEFVRGLRQTHEIEDFPVEGQTTTVEWQQG